MAALRADARRNADQIRQAAIEVFQERGLDVPLEEVAAAAGVSKATIFNRFGGRIGLIEAVIEETVVAELDRIIAAVRAVPEPGERLAAYVRGIRDLQYRRPAANDVLLQGFPHSEQLMGICHAAEAIGEVVLEAGREAGSVPSGFTAEDLHAVIRDNALALKHGGRPPREDYDRRTGFVLEGITRTRRP